MDIALLIVWLCSLFMPGHSALAKIDNENLEYIKYAYEKAVENNISPAKLIKIMNCESGFNEEAFNPETLAKKKGITKNSSCGLLQHNDKRCNDRTSELYDAFYSIDLGIKKYKEQGFSPWLNCLKKI
jgi:hypothetical protein